MIDSLYSLVTRLGFTDPLHAPLTHIPIGLVIGAFLFFLVAVIFGRKNLFTTARHVSILAFLFVFPTILFGVFDWLHFFKGALIPTIKIKMILASSVLVLLGIGIIVGGEMKVHAAPMLVIYGLAFVCVVGLGWFGGRLVYGEWSAAPAAAAAAAAATGGAAVPAATGATATGGTTAAAATTAAAPTAAAAAIASGQRLFDANCSSCHPRGGNVVEASLPLKKSRKLASAATLTSFVRAPTMPNGQPGGMPPFSADMLSDAQVADIHAYVVSMVPVWK